MNNFAIDSSFLPQLPLRCEEILAEHLGQKTKPLDSSKLIAALNQKDFWQPIEDFLQSIKAVCPSQDHWNHWQHWIVDKNQTIWIESFLKSLEESHERAFNATFKDTRSYLLSLLHVCLGLPSVESSKDAMREELQRTIIIQPVFTRGYFCH